MAFEAKNFVLCSKFNLFKAHCNLWIYCTGDTLEQCMATNYFQPRRNLKNQDSPEVGDVIQLVVEHSKLAYLKIVAKTEQPYNITVARTFLENEATLLSLITALQLDKAGKVEDFVSAITDTNKGLTQVEQAEIEEKIDLAANSGRMITPQGFWYAKMYAATVAPSAEDGTNYADFSQVDGQGNPIIVTYNRVNGAWVQDQTITPPADYDGYVPITSKIWDIPEQDGQQGGRILWNHTSKQFTPYPQIVSFDSIEITGNSTVEMPQNPSDDNIANVGFVKSTIGGARNIGDIFLTTRKDSALNGAVECNGATYQTTDFSGAASVGQLLALNKIPYVSLATYQTLLNTQGSCGVFGWDGVGTTAFRVPSLEDIFIETGTAAQLGDFVPAGLPNITGKFWNGGREAGASGAFYTSAASSHQNRDYSGDQGAKTFNFDASRSSSVYGNGNTVQPKSVRYRAMVQLAVSATDEAIATCTSVLADVAANTAAIATNTAAIATNTTAIATNTTAIAANTTAIAANTTAIAANTTAIAGADYVIESQLPTAANNYTWYRKYKSGWVEQGGISDHVTGTSGTITLPVTMQDNNYTAIAGNGNNAANNYFTISRLEATTTTIKWYKSSTNMYGYWEVKGMAQG